MNAEQVTSLVRQILLFGGGIAVGKGWIDNETMLAIVGALVTLATSAWAFKTRTKASIVASAAAKVEVPFESQRAAGIIVPQQPKQ